MSGAVRFFHEPESFRMLEESVLPELVQLRSAGEDFRMWVPGCASGADAYSLAMLGLERTAASGKALRLKVFGTDEDREALRIARGGVFPGTIAEDVGVHRLRRFFTRREDCVRVKKPLRDAVLFARHDLLTDVPFSHIDVISCSGLFSRLEGAYREQVLRLLHFALNDGGYLVLGPCADLGTGTELFTPVAERWGIFRRVGSLRERIEFPIMPAVFREGRWHASVMSGSICPPPGDLVCMNASLQSANEQLVTSVEELHALNETLAANNARLEENAEELRSLNDALVTSHDLLAWKTEQLRQEHALSAAVLETAPVHIVVHDSEGRIERCNHACEEASGYRQDEILGQLMAERLLLPEDGDIFRAGDAQLRSRRSQVRHEARLRHRDGSVRTIAWSRAGLYSVTGALQHVVNVGIDVTDQRRVEEIARQRQRELLHMYCVHTAGGIAAALAHELNQPLAALVAYCETSLSRLRAGEADLGVLTADIEKAAFQAHRAAEIIQELRKLLRKGSQSRVRADLGRIVRTVHELTEAEANAGGVRLVIDIEPGLPPIMAATIYIEQLLMNLVRNSIEAIAGSGAAAGTVTVTVRQNEEGMILVRVADTGPGLSSKAVRRMFDPFFSTKKEGLGMGLPICRLIAEAHGGRLWAETDTGGGAVLSFTIPATR